MLYIFWMLQRTLYGPSNSCTENFADLSAGEMVILTPIMLLLLITGIVPSLFIPLFEPYVAASLQDLITTIGAGQ